MANKDYQASVLGDGTSIIRYRVRASFGDRAIASILMFTIMACTLFAVPRSDLPLILWIEVLFMFIALLFLKFWKKSKVLIFNDTTFYHENGEIDLKRIKTFGWERHTALNRIYGYVYAKTDSGDVRVTGNLPIEDNPLIMDTMVSQLGQFLLARLRK